MAAPLVEVRVVPLLVLVDQLELVLAALLLALPVLIPFRLIHARATQRLVRGPSERSRSVSSPAN